MALFNFLKPKKENEGTPVPAIEKRLEEIALAVETFLKKQKGYSLQGAVYHSSEKSHKFQPSDFRSIDDLIFLSNLLPRICNSSVQRDTIKVQIISSFLYKYTFTKTPLSDEDFYTLVKNWKDCPNDYGFRWSAARLFNTICKRIEANGINEVSKNLLLLFQTPEDKDYFSVDEQKRNERISYLLRINGGMPVDKNDEWGEQVIFIMDTLQPIEKAAWVNLFNHCIEGGEGSSPAKSWLQKTEPFLNAVGKEVFAMRLSEWLAFTGVLLQALHKEGNSYMGARHNFLRDVNHNLLKNLIWCAGLVNDTALSSSLDNYASWAYKKKPGTGPLSAKTATACMVAFSMLSFKEAVTRLMKFRNRTTNNTMINSIDKIIAAVAQKHGYAKDLVEEIGVMDFGLNISGSKTMLFGNVSCIVQLDKANNVIANWYKEGKPLKTVPAAVKSEHATAYKELKKELTELAAQVQVQKARIEGYYLQKRQWTYPDWKENYCNHPLVGAVASKLIWCFTTNAQTTTGICEGDTIVSASGEVLQGFNDETTVSLWHPINAAVEEVIAWRGYLQANEIVQPFKQGFREVYLLTDAELRTSTYSNRFAAHVLRQHQFAALTKQRGWQYHLMGNWDSHNTPTVVIPDYKMTAQYYVNAEGADEETHNGIFLYVTTDQVRFYKEGQLQELIDVPRLVFSEIMRDVDLFVGVTSIGNDPAWADNAHATHNAYWHGYSFGDLSESAKMRSSVLQSLVPRLKIRDKCTFDGKFLKVKGSLRTYKIHMGSGNILMEPNDQYLCIVPAGRSPVSNGKIYLPFEGDNLLSIIVSKALLLADDETITDETIVRQITT